HAAKKPLNGVASTLSGLSRTQIAEVITRLEAAAAAKTEDQAGREMDAARERHKEILRSLKGLLSRYDAMKSLDQAAERLEKAATQQFDLSRQSARTLQDLEDVQKARNLTPKEQNELTERLRNQ